ncbi:NosD domain-containing protein [Streptomyces sp. 150FB]|uniref:NosD domain-containing protein n=1 Tax=Streptomyces sp. 150FB TaxID=1576605 RepID=UPI0012378CE9|nr:NosD domain-containing protein [Streptomyces sp. 150FB]
MSPQGSITRRLLRRAGPIAAVLGLVLAAPVVQSAAAAPSVTLYASPSGAGSTCSSSSPCSLSGAQSAVRTQLAANGSADVSVLLADGVYRLSKTWSLGTADSGTPGHPVVWKSAPGARPVISGASQVTGWTQVGSSGVWSAPVPRTSDSRQLYVGGHEAPMAQATPASLGFRGSWTGSSTGYTISGDQAAMAWFGSLTASQVAGVEFDYPGGNGPWTESRCRVASFSAAAGTLKMSQPCWTDVTARASFAQGSGGLPSMSTNTMPALIENARTLIGSGQWFLDGAGGTLYYKPSAGQQMSALDVELPHLESLVQGAGTLDAPVHDITLSGLQFSFATWNAPSTSAGFADVQSNLRMTGANNQGMCTFSTPAGSCPWGSLTQPLANVSFTASKNITLTGNRFAELGGAGLNVMYGAANTLIQGNEFTDIASTAILLGCTYDPLPTDPSEAAGISQNCTSNGATERAAIGTNEILTGTTVADNVIHHIGTDYSSASGITLLFSQHTTITRNNLYDLPYTGITAGVVQGHVDQASTPQNSTNINSSNTISDNIFHDYLSVRSDGGAIYVEGHQAQYVYQADGKTIDPVQTLAKGLQVTGNIAYHGPSTNFTYYDDAGSEWVNWQGNVAFGAGGSAQGGCSPTGHFWITGNYFSAGIQSYPCAQPVDTHASGNTTIPATPKPTDLPNALLKAAGAGSGSFTPVLSVPASIFYVSPTAGATQVLVAGEGFGPSTPVYIGSTPVSNVTHLSSGFMIVPVPAGTTAGQISVTPQVPGSIRVNDDDSRVAYSGFTYAGGRSYGDYQNDVHYATASGSTASLTFTGTTVTVYGEQNTDQGNIGVSVDGGAQQVVSTLPSDGVRHANVAVYTSGRLSSGTHTVVVTKLSGQYSTLDGFTV